jgi:prepilin-type N-terminal cleavage/methylation domain-containing protein
MEKGKRMIRNILKKQEKRLKLPSGFSLIELMVVVAILALITLGLVAIFSGGVRSYITGNAQLESQRNTRQAMDRMVRELRHGKRVLNYSPHSIEVRIPDIDGASGYNVTYSWSGTPYDPLERTTSGVTNQVINDVLNLQFDNTTSPRINILLEVDAERDGRADISLNTAVNLRNF